GVRPPAVSLEEGLRRVKRCSRRAMSSTSRGLLSREVDIDADAAAGLAWESTMHPTSVRTKRWTRLEYERLIELGGFQPGERIELVGGQLIVREPQGTPHSTGIRLVARARPGAGLLDRQPRGPRAGSAARPRRGRARSLRVAVPRGPVPPPRRLRHPTRRPSRPDPGRRPRAIGGPSPPRPLRRASELDA